MVLLLWLQLNLTLVSSTSTLFSLCLCFYKLAQFHVAPWLFLLCREIALEGLSLVKDDGQIMSQKQELHYPKLGVMLDYILRQQPNLLDSSEMREQKLHFPSKTYLVMIQFLLKCFDLELEQDSSIKGSTDFQSSVEVLCLLLEHAMAFEGSVELHAQASKALIAIGSCMPEVVIEKLFLLFTTILFPLM